MMKNDKTKGNVTKIDGTREIKIETIKALQMIMNDKIDIEVFRLEELIEKKYKSSILWSMIYSLAGYCAITIVLIVLALMQS